MAWRCSDDLTVAVQVALDVMSYLQPLTALRRLNITAPHAPLPSKFCHPQAISRLEILELANIETAVEDALIVRNFPNLKALSLYSLVCPTAPNVTTACCKLFITGLNLKPLCSASLLLPQRDSTAVSSTTSEKASCSIPLVFCKRISTGKLSTTEIAIPLTLLHLCLPVPLSPCEAIPRSSALPVWLLSSSGGL